MGASELIGRLALAGVRLSVLGPDQLFAAPREALTDDLRALIRENKVALLAALAPVERGAQTTAVSPIERLAQRAVDVLRTEPGRRLAVVSDAEPQIDERIQIGYARRTDDGRIVTAVILAVIDPFDLLALVEKYGCALMVPGISE